MLYCTCFIATRTTGLSFQYLCLHVPGNVCGDLLLPSGGYEDVTLGCEEVLFRCFSSREAYNGTISLKGKEGRS